MDLWLFGRAKISPFQNMVVLHIKLKEMEHTTIASKYFDPTHTLGPFGGVKRSNFLSESSHVAYQNKGKEAQ